MALEMRRHDWQASPLGHPNSWPQSLKSIVRTLLTSRYQMWLGWGKELAFFYNDAYSPTLGIKHPWALGKPASLVWKEIWKDIQPLADRVMTSSEATYNEGMLLFLERSGFPEETYHTFSYSPLFDDAGAQAGLLCVVVEETDRVINERRLDTLRTFSFNQVTHEAELFADVQTKLNTNQTDLPFTLTYIFDEKQTSASLVAASGIEFGHAAAPALIAVNDGIWQIQDLQQHKSTRLITDLAEKFGALPTGTWNKPATEALLIPITHQGTEQVAGFFITAINPYRRLDDAYRGFVELLTGQLSAALARVRAMEQERKRAASLAELDRVKTMFFSNVSHEFRTPLTLMLGPLEELLSPHVQSLESARLQARLAYQNGLRLLRLVNSLLDFSRIEAGRTQAAFVPTDLSVLSAEIASSFRSAIEKAGLKLNVNTTALPQLPYVDQDMWEKILLNLLSNAFKYTLSGEITVSVTVSQNGDATEVAVTDTGIGIPQEELPRLFERFHRVEQSQGRSFEGTGIGLALVNELVKQHSGTIRVSSVVNQGSTFVVSIPFGKDHLPADQIKPALARGITTKSSAFVEEALHWLPNVNEPASAQTSLEPGSSAPNGKHVLLADDNQDMREYVSRLLTTEGYRVQAVPDGEAALVALGSAHFDLVLTDIMMPGMNGFELLQVIRTQPNIAGVPVILLSARAGEEAKVEGLQAGADDYLIKPFSARELLARINTNIQMATVRREATRALMASEQRYQLTQERLTRAISTGRVAVYEWNLKTDSLRIYGPLTEAFGVSMESATQGLPLQSFIEGIHPEDRDRTVALVMKTVETKVPFEAEYRLGSDSGLRTVLSRGRVEETATGEQIFAGVLIDLTQEKAAEQKLLSQQKTLQEQTRALSILNRTAALVAGDTSTESLVQAVTDAGVELIGAEFGAFFYNVQDEAGERYTLYTLSGVAQDAFANFPMPRNTAVFAPTFEGTGIVRSDDITQDSRYGKNAPHHGMPKGHLPVRSYLAAPVKSTEGEVLGGLFFGHSNVAVFDERCEELISGLAGSAAVAMDNLRLLQAVRRELEQRRAAETALQQLNSNLEERVRNEVAERTKTEEALRQSQKMEAVGQLTGGVAHDFNNLLTLIIGGLDTIRRAKPADEARIKRGTEMALQGAQRAAHLTSRLLAFSRRQPLEPKPLDFNSVVRDMTELLHRTLGETIELEGVLASRLWATEVDQNQLESVIINLAVNARDAMPEGGKLTIETSNTALDASYVQIDSEVIPGQYVMLAVSDTGCGMTEQTLLHAFEPFFTTKEVGRGTGLGLSMVYGFVKQSGGHVTIYSEIDHGTTVKLYFPRYTGQISGKESPPITSTPSGGRDEVILVVEDNEDVRKYSVMVLSELGYQVLEAGDADTALVIVNEAPRIDLLFTDVVLPGKSGKSLADLALAIRPDMKVLYTTGYSRNAIVHHGRLDPGVQLIVKPFTFDELAKRIRELMDKT
ncbi:MAG: ATP-binding protein [Steroidobacteraceae bacterium]